MVKIWISEQWTASCTHSYVFSFQVCFSRNTDKTGSNGLVVILLNTCTRIDDRRPVSISKNSVPAFFNTAQPTVLSAGGRAEGEAVGLPPTPGEDGGLCPGVRASDVDGMTKEI